MTTQEQEEKKAPLLGNLSVQNIFKLRTNDLQELFKEENITSNEGGRVAAKSVELLQKCGNTYGLMRRLATEANTGIIGD